MYPFTNIDYVRHVPNYTRAHDVDTVDAMPDPLAAICDCDRAGQVLVFR